jgi:hypothetical protein
VHPAYYFKGRGEHGVETFLKKKLRLYGALVDLLVSNLNCELLLLHHLLPLLLLLVSSSSSPGERLDLQPAFEPSVQFSRPIVDQL